MDCRGLNLKPGVYATVRLDLHPLDAQLSRPLVQIPRVSKGPSAPPTEKERCRSQAKLEKINNLRVIEVNTVKSSRLGPMSDETIPGHHRLTHRASIGSPFEGAM